MIRVEPGSTPGIGITITEHFFFVFCAMFVAFCFFARGIGRMSLLQQRCWKKFSILLLHTYIQILGFGDYLTTSTPTKSMKNMDTLEEPHLSALLWPPLPTYLTIGMTEPTLPGRYTCISSSRIAVQCSAVRCRLQTDRQTLPDRSHDGLFYGMACSTALPL